MSTVQEVRPRAWIKFLRGPLNGSTIEVVRSTTTIGRDSSNDIIIADPKVSRSHARLAWNDGSWKIEKLSQLNVVTVNQQDTKSVALSHSDVVELGQDTAFLFLLSVDSIPGEEEEIVQPSSSSEHVAAKITAESISDGQGNGIQVQSSSPSDVAQGQIAAPEKTEAASLSQFGIPSMEITAGTGNMKQRYPLAQQMISIGQDAKNDVVIPDLCVSDFHVQIVREGDEYVLIHPHPKRQQTENGLQYQGRIIKGNETLRKPLTRGDVFRIADEDGTLVTLAYNDGSGSKQEVVPRVQPMQLGAAEITIGRLKDNTVVLDHPQVSAHHARLTQEQGSYRLTDLQSTNHSYVNGLLATNQLLQSGDEVRIGPFKFIYTATQLTQYDESKGIRIDALALKKVGNNQTVLLNDISLSIPARSFVVLVGGSGAGKTTLLDALSGLRPAQEGSVLYNGQDYYQNLAAFSTQLGYVPQEDIIHRDLSVERALYYAAKLRLPQDFTEEQISQRIDEVLDDVEIKHRRTLLISRLSGGQRKRVSIALELLAKPSVFFLDEPTSGLDPGLDRKMMLLLRKLADKGHTIILVTHATNNINACDYVCFLAAGGNLAYFGPPKEAKTYFNKPDFAEIYSTLDPGDDRPRLPVEAGERFRASRAYQEYISDPLSQVPRTSTQLLRKQQKQVQNSQKGKGWRQFFLLTQRYLELLRNDRVNLAILLLQAPIIGLLLLILIKGVGSGGFDPGTVIQCPATAAIVAPGGYPDVPTPLNPIVSKSCPRVVNFLTNNPLGAAYAKSRGGVNKALQDFVVSGPGEASSVLFLMSFAAIMFGCVNAIREIVKEAPIYKRERAVNVGILPYMFSKIVVLTVLCLLQSLVLIVCVSVFDPFQHSIFLSPFLEIYITLALTSLSGLMLGLMISALAPNSDRASGIVPLLLLPQVIFSGAVFPLTNWFLQIVGVFIPARWAMAALSSSVGLHSDKVNGDELFGTNPSYHGTLYSIYTQHEALQYLLLMWLALVIMILVFGIAVGIFLKQKDLQR